MNIKNALKYFDKIDKDQYIIFAIMNAKKITEERSPAHISHADDSEFFSNSEFKELSIGISSLGFYINYFYSEHEFIKYIISLVEKNKNLDNIVVLNFARDGTLEGKKSLIPSFCDYYGIKHSSSNPLTISLLRNKYYLSQIESSISPKSYIYTKNIKLKPQFNSNDTIIVKNIYESASIGMTEDNILQFKTLEKRYNHFFSMINNDKFLIQEYIDGIEVEVPIFKIFDKYICLDPVVIKIAEDKKIITSDISDLYKYDFGDLNDINLIKILKDLSIQIAEDLNIQIIGRIDFRIKDNKPYLIDIAGSPYIIQHSSFAYRFHQLNLQYEDIFKMIAIATLHKTCIL